MWDHVPASELPALWNQKYQEYLGITPANDAEGILQDLSLIHIFRGGYFPHNTDGEVLLKIPSLLRFFQTLLQRPEVSVSVHQ